MDYKGIAKKIKSDLTRKKTESNDDSKLDEALRDIQRIRNLPVSQLKALLAEVEITPVNEWSLISDGIDYGESLKEAMILDLKSWIQEALRREKTNA